MARTLILYHRWPNLAGNHAGMAYFMRQYQRAVGRGVRMLHTAPGYGRWPARLRRVWIMSLAAWLRWRLGRQDGVLFLEYLGGRQCGDHREVALALQRAGSGPRRLGLVNLPISHMRGLYSEDYIREGLAALDEIVVMGSALQRDLQQIVPDTPVRRIPHFVDTEFYSPGPEPCQDRPVRCIAMGFLQRDAGRLRRIVQACPAITFDVCIGNRQDLHRLFEDVPNAVRHPFLPEVELRRLMQQADMSISVLEDSVGNNVIVTSLACGLPQVLSDVGSVRDYCSEEQAVFCQTDEEFIGALTRLADSPATRGTMRAGARSRAESLSIARTIASFRALMAPSP